MASGTSNRSRYNTGKKLIDLSTDSLKIALLDNSYVFDPDHDVFSDVSSHELAAGSGYSSGGKDLADVTLTQDDSGNAAVLDATDVAWTGFSGTTRFAVIYDTTVSNTIIAIIDFGSDKTVSADTFTIQWSTAGILKIV